MSTYCYTLRKPTVRIETVDGPIAVPEFKFAFGNANSWNHTPRTEVIRNNQLTAAERAFEHHAGPKQYKPCETCEGGKRFYRYCTCSYGRRELPQTILALDGEWLVRTQRSNYLDGPSLEDIHVEVVGKVVKEGRKRILVRTADVLNGFSHIGG